MLNRRILPLLTTVLLDGIGIGLTLPILPGLLRAVGQNPDLGWRYGAFLGLYALMQFLCSPLLGGLSDRFGRRPIIMISLAGAAIDYLFMSFAPTLSLLFAGRAIAGATSANMAVATAYVADVTPEDERARAFGQLSACVGLGFIAGPVLGGVLGESWVRAPFLAAAALNAINLLLVAFMLPEAAPQPGNDKIGWNPFRPMAWAFSFPALVPLIGAYVVIGLVGEVGGTIWVLYCQDRFGWDALTIGFSLAGFGLFHAAAQAFVAGPVAERCGERFAMILGIVADSLAYILIALTTSGWVAFALLPLFCLGGIAAPALQSLLSRQVEEEHQGRLQGVLAGFVSLTSVIGPVIISTAYFATRAVLPGLVWIGGAALYLLCIPALIRMKPAAGPADAADRI